VATHETRGDLGMYATGSGVPTGAKKARWGKSGVCMNQRAGKRVRQEKREDEENGGGKDK